jgi:hypothetical protein
VVIQENDLLRAKIHFLPNLSEAAGIVGIDNNPQITGIPKLDLARTEQELRFRIEEAVTLGQLVGVVNPTGFLGALQIVEKRSFSPQAISVGQEVCRNQHTLGLFELLTERAKIFCFGGVGLLSFGAQARILPDRTMEKRLLIA